MFTVVCEVGISVRAADRYTDQDNVPFSAGSEVDAAFDTFFADFAADDFAFALVFIISINQYQLQSSGTYSLPPLQYHLP